MSQEKMQRPDKLRAKTERLRQGLNDMMTHLDFLANRDWWAADYDCGTLIRGPAAGAVSFAQELSCLTGLPLVVWEVPSAVRGHEAAILAQPASWCDSGSSALSLTPVTYNVAFGYLSELPDISDERLATELYQASRLDSDLRRIYEAFGGTRDLPPTKIRTIRAHYRGILLLNGYFRLAGDARPLLSSLSKGKFGLLEALPHDVFVLYAQDDQEEGVDHAERTSGYYCWQALDLRDDEDD